MFHVKCNMFTTDITTTYYHHFPIQQFGGLECRCRICSSVSFGLVRLRFPCQRPAFGQQGEPWVAGSRFGPYLGTQRDTKGYKGKKMRTMISNEFNRIRLEWFEWCKVLTDATLCEETASTPKRRHCKCQRIIPPGKN